MEGHHAGLSGQALSNPTGPEKQEEAGELEHMTAEAEVEQM